MKKKGVKNEKKNGADTEMGYCPFEHKAGRTGRALGVLALGERGVGARYGRHNTATRPAGQPRHSHCARLGVLAGVCVCTLCT